MSEQFTTSRRSLAKGAAWAVPTVALAAGAPAMAASPVPTTIGSTVCDLFYGGGTVNQQTHSIFFSFTSTSGIIPAGTTVTQQVCVDPSTNPDGLRDWKIPTNTYPGGSTSTSTDGAWYIHYTTTGGTPLTAGTTMTGAQCFNVLFTFNQDVSTTTMGCLNGIIWNDIYTLRPASTITVTSNTSVTGPTGVSAAASGSLGYRSARRVPTTINTAGRLSMKFTSKSGSQSCYPQVEMSQMLQSDGADDVVCYPSGTNITTSRCNWTDGTSTTCAASSTGLCTPPYKGAVSGQTTIPQMC